MRTEPLPASFRDPAGFVYTMGGELYRQVNRQYQPQYDLLMRSGLYDELVKRSWLVPHEEVALDGPPGDAYRVLKPRRIPYVSYPYEWCFSQLKDAALLTLDIQLLSLSFGITLKDASAYNVQFAGCRPVFIDTLSFDRYEEGAPWLAYGQFCRHFLAPLALMAHVDAQLGKLLRSCLDGIPLDLACRVLPSRTRLRPGLLAHLHLHAWSQARHQHSSGSNAPARLLPRSRLLALLQSLRGAVLRCQLPARRTQWSEYYADTNYSSAAMAAKESTVRRMIDAFAKPSDLIHDLGANTGRFSRVVARPGRYVVAQDLDELAVERHYLANRKEPVEGVLPLVLDLTNPSPGIGWALEERTSALDRLARSTVVALALIHHLAISHNVPLPAMAEFFGRIANTLIVEFVPKEDAQVRRLLASRQDVFPHYTQPEFERAFSACFEILAVEQLPDTARTLFAMKRKV